ncbi:MAG: proton-conducting membrane transporter [Clostridia bacterium]|nr:proton-conducting membrane transporter [Clostridia bacterium]
MILYSFIIIPLAAGILIYLVPKRQMIRFAFLLQLGLLGLSAYNFIMIRLEGPREMVLGGFEIIAGISLRCDTLSGALLILTAFIFTMCYIFGLMDRLMSNLFIFLFLVLQALVTTIFLSRDLFNIYVVTEVSTIIVAVLIMFKKDSRSIYDGMLYLITNIAAMTFFLFGTAFIYKSFGTLDIDMIEAKMHAVANPKALILPFSLIMTGVCLKCAFVPLFSWLPKAHATPSAPSIVSVILSGLYVKCGIYMFIRMREMFMPAIAIDEVFLYIGIATGIAGFVMAMAQKDIKLILAYHTISQMGLILMGISYGNQFSYYGGVLHLFNHAIFKSLLFFFAGIIISKYKTRDITKIRGVFKRMPYVSVMAFAAMLGITGAPLFNGSVSKYFIESGLEGSIVEYEFILISAGTIISFIKFSQIFPGNGSEGKIRVDRWKKAAVTIMGFMCIAMGLGGTIIIGAVFNYEVSINAAGYARNAAIFLISLAGGYFLYTKYLKKTRFIREGISIELGVNEIGICIAGFFAFITAAAYLIK